MTCNLNSWSLKNSAWSLDSILNQYRSINQITTATRCIICHTCCECDKNINQSYESLNIDIWAFDYVHRFAAGINWGANGTSTEQREALTGCSWLSGRWRMVLILPLGGDMAVSYLGHFFLPLCPQCSQCFIAHHLHIQLRISQLRFLLLFLLTESPHWWPQATIILWMCPLI